MCHLNASYKLFQWAPFHTGNFAQNFFHISVILGCIPLLFLQFWVKGYKNKPLTTLEVTKETLGFILKIMKKIARWRHNQKISIKSMKTVISPLFLHFWSQHGYQKKQKTSRNSNLLVWSATFQPKLNKLWKTIKKVLIFVYFYGFSSSLKYFASFDTNVANRNGEIVAGKNLEPKSLCAARQNGFE